MCAGPIAAVASNKTVFLSLTVHALADFRVALESEDGGS